MTIANLRHDVVSVLGLRRRALSGFAPYKNTTVRRPFMTDERPEIYEAGVILEDLEIEELEEVIAPGHVLTS